MPSTALASPARVRAGVLMGALPAALLLAALVAGVALGARTVPATTALDTLGAVLTGHPVPEGIEAAAVASRVPRVVHVRDTLLANPDTPVLEFSRDPISVSSATTVQKTLDHMRSRNEQLVVVGKADKDKAVWILTWDDIMGQLWPQITEQLDKVTPPPAV